ncbi:hypothetical protein pipiens_009176 [Culex pipiens pipiens]|uniref:F-box domain-containing protein n=1 Tax=Culex pipiens pipiens TaxID=38569 RepID=A0ABD1DF05_CULPP
MGKRELKQKETEPVAASISDLPNEVLLMIFDRLELACRLRVSQVCHRWNQLVFHFFGDHFALKLDDLVDPGLLSKDRVYRRVEIRCMSLLRFNMLHAKRLRVLGRHVVALTLDISVTDGDLFVEMLRKFPNLESFSLWTESFRSDKPARNALRKVLPGRLPSVRHVTIYCNNAAVLDLMARLAPNLRSLNVTVPAKLLSSLCQCDLAGLISLRLSLVFRSKALLSEMASFRRNVFDTFMASLKNLKKFSIFIRANSYPEISPQIFALASLEQLEVTTTDSPRPVPAFDGIWNLRNLKVLRCFIERIAYPPEHAVKPLEHLTELNLAKAIVVDTFQLRRIFPNVTTLDIRSCQLSEPGLESLSLAWPRLESLTVRIAPVEIDSLVVLHRFAKLRQLTLLNNYISDREDLAVLDTVLAIGTLEELRVEGKWDGAPGGLNPTCRVFRNGEVVAREELPLGRHGFLELYTLKGDCDED